MVQLGRVVERGRAEMGKHMFPQRGLALRAKGSAALVQIFLGARGALIITTSSRGASIF